MVFQIFVKGGSMTEKDLEKIAKERGFNRIII